MLLLASSKVSTLDSDGDNAVHSLEGVPPSDADLAAFCDLGAPAREVTEERRVSVTDTWMYGVLYYGLIMYCNVLYCTGSYLKAPQHLRLKTVKLRLQLSRFVGLLL
jgi:hypothetical protein